MGLLAVAAAAERASRSVGRPHPAALSDGTPAVPAALADVQAAAALAAQALDQAATDYGASPAAAAIPVPPSRPGLDLTGSTLARIGEEAGLLLQEVAVLQRVLDPETGHVPQVGVTLTPGGDLTEINAVLGGFLDFLTSLRVELCRAHGGRRQGGGRTTEHLSHDEGDWVRRSLRPR
jgi:hypothetical protein